MDLHEFELMIFCVLKGFEGESEWILGWNLWEFV